MLYLAFIYHMHQPYYKNLLTQEVEVPWVRLHGIKDYLDMVQILANYPAIHQTFNLVPSLIEQIEDYTNGKVKDKFLELSYKPAGELTQQDKEFIRERFFMINKDRVIAMHPRYFDLYFKKQGKKELTLQDYLDLQVWFNLSWFDPSFRDNILELKNLTQKGRFFTEEEKRICLDKQFDILRGIIPAYKKFYQSGQIEITVTPYYHPILPLLYNTKIAKEANPKSTLPKINFAYPEDAQAQVGLAINFFKDRFGTEPKGMWPSEQSVAEQILPILIQSGIQWVIADEGILFKSLKKKRRDARLLYQPHSLKRKEGSLNIVFRDCNLSDLIGFTYYNQKAEDAVKNFMSHLENIHKVFNDEDILVTLGLDGENAWEYYPNDGHDFLALLYQQLSEAKFLKTVTISEYLKINPPVKQIKHLAAGSWIYAEFSKWINNPYKNKAWEYLALARKELKEIEESDKRLALGDKLNLAYKQIYIAEGSDWFWWYGEQEREKDFDYLFRMHLSNFYTIIGKDIPDYLKSPLEP